MSELVLAVGRVLALDGLFYAASPNLVGVQIYGARENLKLFRMGNDPTFRVSI